MSVFAIPLQVGTPQTLSITLSGVPYQLTFLYRNDPAAGWTVDIADAAGNPIVQGIPLVTGADLLAQYRHLGFTGALVVQTISDPDDVPTFANLGSDGQVYYVSPPIVTVVASSVIAIVLTPSVATLTVQGQAATRTP